MRIIVYNQEKIENPTFSVPRRINCKKRILNLKNRVIDVYPISSWVDLLCGAADKVGSLNFAGIRGERPQKLACLGNNFEIWGKIFVDW